ncbi:MAG: DNA alkylation repair protein [Nanoarchaeota archaeon]|jgi:3-methyladenine DNA glycosylase AlkD|nr:DNA alkylation repair protein [Nanoarchaeota archaeon]
MSLHHLTKDIQRASTKEKAKGYIRFFKQEYTAKEDRFIGVSMPDLRQIAKRHPEVTMQDVQKLLKSDIHEYRMLAGVMLVNKFREAPSEELVQFYIKNIRRFNNWDLVDATCDKILGRFLLDKKKQRKLLYDFAKSSNLWEKRIAIISTFEFIRHNEFGDTLKIAEILLSDKHDLTHKATGWMLREVGKRRKEVLLDFLKTNYDKIPRTTLRYAIEKFPEEKRKEMLDGKF